MPDKLAKLEVQLGYRFQNRELLRQALRHASVDDQRLPNYERLEFLGDRVLGVITADWLFHLHRTAAVGDLHTRQQQLVPNSVCAEVAEQIGLSNFVTVGKSAKQGGQQISPAILGDVMEALVAAVYLDGGFDAARSVIDKLWGSRIKSTRTPVQNPKTELQEWSQGQGLGLPSYTTSNGQQHAVRVQVSIGKKLRAHAEAANRRTAEARAAAKLLAQVTSHD